jgi:hypothetical protein
LPEHPLPAELRREGLAPRRQDDDRVTCTWIDPNCGADRRVVDAVMTKDEITVLRRGVEDGA